MAHTRTADKDARVLEQCSKGRCIRNIASKSFIVANDRSDNIAPGRLMADVIINETEILGLFVAPCDCKVVRISANGTPFIDQATSGTATVTVTKAVIGGSDVALCTALSISGVAAAPASDTAIDATLVTTAGVLDLLEGQHVYLTVAVSNHAVETLVAYITAMMEWVPMDASQYQG